MVDGRLSTSRITFTSEIKYVWYMVNHLAIRHRLTFVNMLILLILLPKTKTDVCRRTVSSVKGRAKLLEEGGERRRRRAGRFSPGEDERIIRAVLHHNPAALQVRVTHCTAQTFALLLQLYVHVRPFP